MVHDKSQVVKKALAELIATKWKMVVKPKGKELALDLMAECIANKGRYTEHVEVVETMEVSTPIQVTEVLTQTTSPRPNVTEKRGDPILINEKKREVVIRGSTLPNSRKSHRKDEDLFFENTEPKITHNIKHVPVEVVIEKPVIKEIIVEKPYDVFIEKPVENIIEKEVIVEKIVEIPVERIIEREVMTVENTDREQVEKREVVRERFVQNPVERIVHREVPVDKTEVVEKVEEVEKLIERRIARPHREEVQVVEVREEFEQPVETMVKQVPVPVNKYVDVEEVQYVDKIVEKEVEKLIYVDKYVDIPKEQVVVVEDVVEEEVRQVVNKHVDVVKDVYVDEYKTVRKSKPLKKSVIKEVEVVQEKFVEVEVPTYQDKVVEVEVVKEVPREVLVEKELYYQVSVLL